MILAGDVGGTKTILAYFAATGGALQMVIAKSYPSAQYPSLNDVIAALQEEHPEKVTAAAFGIAGPVVDGRSKLTNLPWEVIADDVARPLGLPSVGLLNDLSATAYGTLRLAKGDTVVLQEGEEVPRGTKAVVAAGTGLGEGGLVWDGRRYRAIPSEGGHTDFAPRNDLEIALLCFMLAKFPSVSYERVISGPGLVHLYEFFRSRASSAEPPWLRERMALRDPAAVISEAGLEGKDDVCVQALDLFVSILGAEAGNVALKLLSTGGLFLGGGIAPKILERLQQGDFLASFVRKGRYEDLLRRVPVHIVLNEKTALLGAAHYALVHGDQG